MCIRPSSFIRTLALAFLLPCAVVLANDQPIVDALFKAVARRDVVEAERLIATNPTVINYSDAACNAATVRDKELVERFVSKTPPRHVPEVVGWALRCAAGTDNNVEILQALIDKGAKVNETSKAPNRRGWTALDIAVAASASSNVDFLQSKGGVANVNSVSNVQRVAVSRSGRWTGPVIKQTYTPDAEARSLESHWNDPRNCAGPCRPITCKALGVGASTDAETTIRLLPSDQSQAGEICPSGTLLTPTMFRVRSGDPSFRWLGAWCLPGKVAFHSNGQLLKCNVARSWLDLAPSRQACGQGRTVYLNEDGSFRECTLRY